MHLPFAFFVGLRYTVSRRRNQLVSFLSTVSIAGLVIGVALLITVLSVMNGFDRELRQRILGLVPQAAIFRADGIENWQVLVREFEDQDGIVAAAPFVQLNALVSYRNQTLPMLLYGIDVASEVRVSKIDAYVPQAVLVGLDDASQNKANILLGKAIAQKLGVGVGQAVMVIVPDASGSAHAPKIDYFTVHGILESKTELDHSLALASLSRTGALSSHPNKVSGIRLKLLDLFTAPTVVYRELLRLDRTYAREDNRWTGNNWTRTHGNLHHAIQMSKNLVGLLMSLIVAIAAFNVVSTLAIVVADKRGDIAILRTLGLSTRQIMAIFVVQGCTIGIIGTLLGVILGCLMSLAVEDIVQMIEAIFGLQFLQSDVYPLTYLPSEIRLQDVSRVATTALGLSLLATLYPAWKASRVQPAQALRYE